MPIKAQKTTDSVIFITNSVKCVIPLFQMNVILFRIIQRTLIMKQTHTKKWDVSMIPDLTGKIAIVTGGNTGLGFQSCLELARRKATVVIACRNEDKGLEAAKEISRQIKGFSSLDVMILDLADLESVKSFAQKYISKYNRLDILMNNAGVVNQEKKGITKDGFETQFGTNHLGHFALTGHLFKILVDTTDSRVVTLSSGGYKYADFDFSDINWEKRPYDRVKSYGASKLANLLFTLKLQNYFDKVGTNTIAVSAHPGLSASPRQQSIGLGGRLTKCLASPLSRGSRSQLLAATDVNIKAIDFYGPKYWLDGPPKLTTIKHELYNQEIADKLWKLSEELTNVSYSI